MHKKSLVFIALFMPFSAQARDAKFNFSVPKECKATLPNDWLEQKMQFIGECKAERIEGDGVLKFYDAKGEAVKKSIIGHFGFGKPISGVIVSAEGYRPFSYENQSFQDSGDRNINISLFNIAGEAANAVALRFDGIGNKESAKFYRKLSHKMFEQMD